MTLNFGTTFSDGYITGNDYSDPGGHAWAMTFVGFRW